MAWYYPVWILWILWALLPSYPRSDDSVAASLSAGQSVTRAYSLDTFKPYDWNGWESHMLLTFQVHEQPNGNKTLTFGGGHDILHKASPENKRFSLNNTHTPLVPLP